MMELKSLIEEYDGEFDPMFFQSVDICIKADRASVKFLDRRLQIGYGRVVAIIDLMTELGIIGPPQEMKKDRPVLVTNEENIRFFEECARNRV